LLERFEDHPLPRFLKSGLLVTLNSDDPAMFGTSLNEEVGRAARSFALSRRQIVEICENSIRAAFLAEDEQAQLLRESHAEAGASSSVGGFDPTTPRRGSPRGRTIVAPERPKPSHRVGQPLV